MNPQSKVAGLRNLSRDPARDMSRVKTVLKFYLGRRGPRAAIRGLDPDNLLFNLSRFP